MPGYVGVIGIATPTTNVTVNGNVATRKDEYFHHALSVTNASALYPTIAVTSQYGSKQSRTGEVFVAASPEVYGYDADGNLATDGRWTYFWDGENRLVEIKRDTSTPTLSSRLRLVFEYDHLGRRIRKYYYTHSGSAWVEQRDTICLYDLSAGQAGGWNVVAELDANASKARLRTYVWGSDLSGTVEGAGGVGGLLWLNNYQTTYDGQTLPTGVHFVSYDGNGNVAALTRASDGSVSARYEYGPFGEPVRQTGALADAQPFRFSTKWTDAETGLLYYGYRYYNPITGRWLTRDPADEAGGLNLYAILDGDALNYIDGFGLDKEARPLPKSATKCCTAQKIGDGEKTLNANFQKAKAAAKARGITPAPGGGAGATCKNSSQDIIDWRIPFPPCWRCHLEERNYYSPQDDPDDTRWDHQVIICTAYLPGPVKNKEIIFDWWGDVHYRWKRDVSGGPPTDFRKEYRYPGKIQNPPYYTNCDGAPGYKGPPPKPCFSCSGGGTQ